MLFIVLFLLLFGIYFLRAYRQQLKINKAIILEKEKLYESNETKNWLLSVLSHDLRPPVHRLKDINMELKAAILKDEKENAIALTNQNTDITHHTYSLLDTMLYWALAESKQLFFKPEKVHVRSLVAQTCFNVMPFLDIRKIALLKRVPRGLFVHADINTLKIALRNIIENAIKYTPENGTIKIYTILAQDQLRLIVADNGTGITPEALKNIFNVHKKERKKDMYGNTGTGLGLQLVKTLIGKNGGEIAIKSKPGKGTKVIITLQYIV